MCYQLKVAPGPCNSLVAVKRWPRVRAWLTELGVGIMPDLHLSIYGGRRRLLLRRGRNLTDS